MGTIIKNEFELGNTDNHLLFDLSIEPTGQIYLM
jgi:hypothetical protein